MNSACDTVTEWEQAAYLGELARPLLHEINNYLNTLQLQIVALQSDLPAEARAELESVRRQNKAVAALIQQWQRTPRRDIPSRPLELPALVNDLVRLHNWQVEGAEAVLELALAPTAVVLGRAAEVQLLLTFLLSAVVEARQEVAPLPPPPLVSGGPTDDRTVVHVVERGHGLAGTDEKELFRLLPERGYGLRLAACCALATRLGVALHVTRNQSGGWTFELQFPRAG